MSIIASKSLPAGYWFGSSISVDIHPAGILHKRKGEYASVQDCRILIEIVAEGW